MSFVTLVSIQAVAPGHNDWRTPIEVVPGYGCYLNAQPPYKGRKPDAGPVQPAHDTKRIGSHETRPGMPRAMNRVVGNLRGLAIECLSNRRFTHDADMLGGGSLSTRFRRTSSSVNINQARTASGRPRASWSSSYESFGVSCLCRWVALHGGLWSRAKRGGTGRHSMRNRSLGLRLSP